VASNFLRKQPLYEVKPLLVETVQTISRIIIQDGLSNLWYSSASGDALAGHYEETLGFTQRRAAYHLPDGNSYIERLHRGLTEEEV
jgi:hypothetical protein